MRRALTALLTVTALAVPSVNAYATTTRTKAAPKKKVVVVRKSLTGPAEQASRWGEVQVTIVVRKTTTTVLATHRSTVVRRIVALRVPQYPQHTDRSIFINEQALPILAQETLRAQGSSIDLVSGATDTSVAFQSSLQAAILEAKAWK